MVVQEAAVVSTRKGKPKVCTRRDQPDDEKNVSTDEELGSYGMHNGTAGSSALILAF